MRRCMCSLTSRSCVPVACVGDLPFQFDVGRSEFGGAFADALFQGPAGFAEQFLGLFTLADVDADPSEALAVRPRRGAHGPAGSASGLP